MGVDTLHVGHVAVRCVADHDAVAACRHPVFLPEPSILPEHAPRRYISEALIGYTMHKSYFDEAP